MLLLAFATVAILLIGLVVLGLGGVALWFSLRRKPVPSLVSPLVRQAINDDLTTTVTRMEVDRVKRDWLKADGWELTE